ncbi:MAG: bifunctional adenosylcobinamide kinase/adenosylcobinamide-phosphate guanylyltransferase [Deltaproteobacteria bacterium]|jgi:adenosylcobinamide kinase/adenosylcobinamide-phosphate guanylyltransferase|nr:bifunctional adenosylcobinamide kinase/adenosylcobinamide-phosphate guanylyltransferase [Deltaproteobacteria bacterium]
MGELILYLGGAKSGKTRAALKEAESRPAPRYYLATAQGLDDEMRGRISRHQEERGPDWRTVEASLDPAGALAGIPEDKPVLLDCITLWFSNLMWSRPLEGQDAAWYMDHVGKLITASAERSGALIVVSNELGSGIVPMEPESRLYRDMVGLAHQTLGAHAFAVYLVVAGIPVKIK